MGSSSIINQLESQWSRLLYTELALPCPDLPNFSSWFRLNARPIVKQHSGATLGQAGQGGFLSVDVRWLELSSTQAWSQHYDHDFLDHWRDFDRQLCDIWPLRSVGHIRFWSSTGPVSLHRDLGYPQDLPLSWRWIVADTNTEPTLKIREEHQGQLGPTHYLDPQGPFAWNDHRVVHGSSYHQGHSKILMILQQAEWDWPRLSLVLEQSRDKYQHSQIWSQLC